MKDKSDNNNIIKEVEVARCMWRVNTDCKGNIEKRKMIRALDNNDRARIYYVPICDGHFEEHQDVMRLHKNGYSVEEIFKKDTEWRRREILTLGLSGLSDEDYIMDHTKDCPLNCKLDSCNLPSDDIGVWEDEE